MAWPAKNRLEEAVKSEDRIAVIKNFVEGHRFLMGLQYRVVFDEPTDTLTIEFKQMREDQKWSLNASLRAHNMPHIKVTAQKIMPAELQTKRRPKRKNNNGTGSINLNS